jgi:outer membrane receptor for ferrienterochelin and colicin
MIRSILLFGILCAVMVPATAWSGNTGKIAGVVKDSQTGEALIGISVTIEGTSTGAATNLDGEYTILNVSPGTYRVTASGVGYTRTTTTDVVVNIDLTTTVDFSLSPTVVALGEEVTVTATRPLVQKDLTAKTAIVGGDKIAALPVTEVSQVLALQAGMVAGSLRGGRSGEVAYWIDGVPVTDAYNGGQVVEVNKSMVQELQMVSGAFNAEYGQAMSGIVNIATKEGGPSFTGSLTGYLGGYAPSGGTFVGMDKEKPYDIRNGEFSLSGPVFGDILTFFANARVIHFDGWLYGYRRFNPSNIAYTDAANVYHISRDASGRGDSSRVPMNGSDRSYGQTKLAWKIAPTVKLTANFIYDHTISKSFNQFYYYNPDGYGFDHNTSYTLISQFSHTLSSTTFYTIGGSAFYKDYQYYVYEDPHDPRYVHPKLFLTEDSWSFATGGTDMNRTKRRTTSYLLKVDLNSQVTQAQLLKGGVSWTTYKMFYEGISLQPSVAQTDINLATDSPFIKTVIPDISTPYFNTFTHHPFELAAYLQDKLEFKNLIVNIGLRYDMFEPDGVVLADPSDPNIYSPIKPSNRFFDYNGDGEQQANEPTKTVADRAAYWYTKASRKSKLSPRIGFSFPITAQGIVHFSYGHFFQTPHFERMYENPDFKIGNGTGNQGIVGNTDLNPEQTISGELGLQQQLSDDISMDVTAYLRDIRNLTGTRNAEVVVFGGSASYSRYQNSDFGFVKGIVLTVNKRFGAGLAATLDYTFQIASGSASNPQDARNIIAGGSAPEVQLNPLDWDQRHTLNISMTYAGTGWGASAIIQYGTGTPYSPRRNADVSALLTNSQTKPGFFNIDLQAYYKFALNPLNLTAFLRVFNVLDIRNEFGVYDDTGRSWTTLYETQALATNPNQHVNTLDQWFHNPTQYSEPRRIELGLTMEF